jgi:hypothetical protein
MILAPRTVFAVATIAYLGIASAWAGLATAHGRNVPYHQSGGAFCYLNGMSATIKAYVPVEMYSYGPSEKIKWSADVFLLKRGKLRPYITSMPWLSNVTTRAGHMDHGGTLFWMWSTSPVNSQPVSSWRFYDLPRGKYRAKEYFQWSNGVVHTQWMLFSRNSPPSRFCTVG